MTHPTTHDHAFQVTLTLREGYEMAADFGLPGIPALVLDEPVPLGTGHGPNAARVLASAVGNCLASSLLFCLRKARVDVTQMRVTVDGTMARNERGRLRITGLRARLEPVVPAEERERMARCMELYEDFCLVSQSVRQGIAVTAEVHPADAAAPAAV